MPARLGNERGRTLDELAQYSGLAQHTLIDLEHGLTTGNITTRHALDHAFASIPQADARRALRRPHPARNTRSRTLARPGSSGSRIPHANHPER
ncbi:hypothetical protein ACFV6E_32740 [Streptomyces sp. NPDC059785]|uniref:hypothetical protein n=1 Tax=Streptomyces sp. NPDC059785 TaxID=3346945 RepID=UPI00365070AD